jgi:hypothetical protein
VLPPRRAFIHGTTPGVKILQHGFGYEQLVDLSSDPDETQDVSWDRKKYDAVLGAEDRLRARLHEIWVPPDPPEPKPEDTKPKEDAAPPPPSATPVCVPTSLPNQCISGRLWHCPPNADRHMLTSRCLPIPIPRPPSYGTDECCP